MAANLNPNLEASRAQGGRILAHLLSGEALTALEALDRFGCSRLAARIEELRRAGWPVVSELVPVGNGKKAARYRLAPGGPAVPPSPSEEPDPRPRETPVRQGGLFALEAEEDGPSWLSRERWER